MKRPKLALSLFIAFAVGCGATQVGSPFVVASARAGTSPTRWEYDCRRVDDGVTSVANKLGAEGWELTAAAGAGWGSDAAQNHTMVWCFKRALP